jgi:hypothetical protein
MDDGLTVHDVMNDRWERLSALADKLGMTQADLVARYVDRGMADTEHRHARSLDDIEDRSRIKRWLPDGTPILRTGE